MIPNPDITQFVVLFPSAQQASAFFDTSARELADLAPTAKNPFPAVTAAPGYFNGRSVRFPTPTAW